MRFLAVITLALLVLTGCQTTDYAAELKRIRPLAEQGDAKAQTRLGAMYQIGRGVTKDSKETLRWFRKAAKQGNAWAQYWLGRMYRYGYGVTRDPKQAARWYRKAAGLGHAKAQTRARLI
jgi:TPR repeat protein